MNKIIGFLSICLLPSCSVASDSSINIPENTKQRMVSVNLSLTTEQLFKAYIGENLEQRRLAEMYVAGVIDSSEGVSWCGFGIASPDAIQEQVYIGLKRAHERSPKERASNAIQSRLKERLPCTGK